MYAGKHVKGSQRGTMKNRIVFLVALALLIHVRYKPAGTIHFRDADRRRIRSVGRGCAAGQVKLANEKTGRRA